MAHTTHYPQAAFSYAEALMELAEERKTDVAALGKELADLRQIIKDNESFRLYLSDPAIGADERAQVLTRIFKSQVTPLLFDVLQLMNDRSRLALLSDVAGAYGELLEEKLGKIEVDLTVAKLLDPKQLESVRQRVGAALKRDAIAHQEVDESIIGGLLIRIEDRLIDASVRYQLQAVKERLLAARPQQSTF